MHTSEQKESDIKDITDISLNKSIPIKDMSVSIPASVVATPVASSATSDLANASSNATAAAMNANRLNNSNIKQEISKGQVMKNNQQQNQLKPNQQTNNKNQQQIQNKNKVNPKNKNFNQNNQQNGNSKPHNDGNQVQKKHHQNGQFKQQQFQGMNSQPQQEKKFTGRCRLFVGNLPSDMTDAEFKELFTKFGEIGETFLNQQRSFGFIKLDTRLNAEHAKQDLDGVMCKGRCLRVRFATHGAAIRIKHLSPFVSNEYLEQAFSQFGPVERAIVIVDEKGRPTGDGIVEFERKPSAVQCINRCSENCFILTSYPRPIVVEPLEQKDEEDGLPEKSMAKNAQYYSERETSPHFAHHGSFEQEIARKWIEFYDLEKQINEEAKQRIEQAKEILEYDIEQRLIDQQTIKIKEDLQRKQEELQRIEEMRKTEVQRRKDYEFRRNDDMGNGGMSKQQQHASSFSMHSNNNRLNQQQATHGGFDQSAMLNQVICFL
jgi:proline- and glutamine-rich splicing factor